MLRTSWQTIDDEEHLLQAGVRAGKKLKTAQTRGRGLRGRPLEEIIFKVQGALVL